MVQMGPHGNPGTPYQFLPFFGRPPFPGIKFLANSLLNRSRNGRPPRGHPVFSWRRSRPPSSAASASDSYSSQVHTLPAAPLVQAEP